MVEQCSSTVTLYEQSRLIKAKVRAIQLFMGEDLDQPQCMQEEDIALRFDELVDLVDDLLETAKQHENACSEIAFCEFETKGAES